MKANLEEKLMVDVTRLVGRRTREQSRLLKLYQSAFKVAVEQPSIPNWRYAVELFDRLREAA